MASHSTLTARFFFQWPTRSYVIWYLSTSMKIFHHSAPFEVLCSYPGTLTVLFCSPNMLCFLPCSEPLHLPCHFLRMTFPQTFKWLALFHYSGLKSNATFSAQLFPATQPKVAVHPGNFYSITFFLFSKHIALTIIWRYFIYLIVGISSFQCGPRTSHFSITQEFIRTAHSQTFYTYWIRHSGGGLQRAVF